MRHLPADLRREVNRLAHAIALRSYMEHRQRLEAEAAIMLRAGQAHDAVLLALKVRAAPGSQS